MRLLGFNRIWSCILPQVTTPYIIPLQYFWWWFLGSFPFCPWNFSQRPKASNGFPICSRICHGSIYQHVTPFMKSKCLWICHRSKFADSANPGLSVAIGFHNEQVNWKINKWGPTDVLSSFHHHERLMDVSTIFSCRLSAFVVESQSLPAATRVSVSTPKVRDMRGFHRLAIRGFSHDHFSTSAPLCLSSS